MSVVACNSGEKLKTVVRTTIIAQVIYLSHALTIRLIRCNAKRINSLCYHNLVLTYNIHMMLLSTVNSRCAIGTSYSIMHHLSHNCAL